MEALSQQLLEEKNVEIDELQNRIQELESRQESSSESSEDVKVIFQSGLSYLCRLVDFLQSIQNFKEENLHLQSQIQEMEQKLFLQQEEGDIKESLESLRKEKDLLQAEILQIKDAETSEENCFPALGIPANIQEKIISDLEHLLESGEKSGHQTPDSTNTSNVVLEGMDVLILAIVAKLYFFG